MPIGKTGRFTFARQYSNWDIVQAQRQFHRAQTQKYLNGAADTASSLQGAISNQITGMASLAGQAAIERIKTVTSALQQSTRSINLKA